MGPAALPAIAIGATVIGTGVSAFGAIQQGQAAKDQANYQAQVAENNAILAQRAADDERAIGREEERRQRIITEQQIGEARAMFAGQGVLVDEGTALDLTSDIAEIGELDALTIRSNAERRAMALEAEGANFQGEASLARARGRNLETASFINFGSTLLTGGGRVADKWYVYDKEGAFA